MPEGKKEYLYSVYQGPLGNEALKEKAREIGAKIKFDREVGAYELVTEGLAKKDVTALKAGLRSEEHTSELQSLMSISYAVFCLKKKKKVKLTNKRCRPKLSRNEYREFT